MRTNIRPDPKGLPTVVTTGVRVIDINEINDVDQSITIDLAIRRVWTDERLLGLEGCRIAFNETRKRLDVTILAERIRAFYVWKVILPISLIVFMSWSVFWIDPAMYGPQIGLSATSMLTIIAFISHAMDFSSPKLPFST